MKFQLLVRKYWYFFFSFFPSSVMWYQQLEILYFVAGILYSGLLELIIKFLLMKKTAWGWVLNFTITQVLQIFHLFKFVQMGGFIRQIHLMQVVCQIHKGCESDTSWVSAERSGHLQIWELPVQSALEQSISRSDRLHMETATQMFKVWNNFLASVHFHSPTF